MENKKSISTKYILNLASCTLLFASVSFSSSALADTNSATVTPKGIGAWTSSSGDTNWNSSEKLSLRLTALYPWSNCSYNSVWFDSGTSKGKTILSLLLSSIATGKQVSITVRDDTKVGGVVCEMVAIETLP